MAEHFRHMEQGQSPQISFTPPPHAMGLTLSQPLINSSFEEVNDSVKRIKPIAVGRAAGAGGVTTAGS